MSGLGVLRIEVSRCLVLLIDPEPKVWVFIVLDNIGEKGPASCSSSCPLLLLLPAYADRSIRELHKQDVCLRSTLSSASLLSNLVVDALNRIAWFDWSQTCLTPKSKYRCSL